MLDSSPCHFLDVSLVIFTSICSAAVTFLVYYRYAQPHTHGSRTSTSVQPDGRNGTEEERGARSRGLHVTVGHCLSQVSFPMFPFQGLWKCMVQVWVQSLMFFISFSIHFVNFFFGMYTLLYVFGCAGSLLVQWVFSSCGEWGLLSTCSAQSSHCGGFSCFGAQALGAWASVIVGHGLSSCDFLALGHTGFSNCSSQALERKDFRGGTWAQLL